MFTILLGLSKYLFTDNRGVLDAEVQVTSSHETLNCMINDLHGLQGKPPTLMRLKHEIIFCSFIKPNQGLAFPEKFNILYFLRYVGRAKDFKFIDDTIILYILTSELMIRCFPEVATAVVRPSRSYTSKTSFFRGMHI